MGGWLNRYDFAYARRDTVKTGLTIFNTIALGLIKDASNDKDKAVERRIQVAIMQGGKK